jgi:hypothetical protein
VKSLYDEKLSHIESWLQETIGMDDASLLKMAVDAEQELEYEKQNMTSEEMDKLDRKSKLEADILLARLDAKGIRPITTEEYEKGRDLGKTRRYKSKSFKAGVVAAAVLGVALIGGISSVAKSEYRYVQYPGKSGGSALIRYNTPIEFKKDELDKAYDQIAQDLGIPVMMLGYMPDGMVFSGIEADGTHAVLKFIYKQKRLFLNEDKSMERRTLSMIDSDRNGYLKLYNNWINKEIQIEENKLENGDIEYSACIEGEEAFYYFSGVMEKTEFIEIVKDLYIDK